MDSYVDERILCETLKDIANACDGYWLDRDVGIFYRLTAEEAKDYITFFAQELCRRIDVDTRLAGSKEIELMGIE